MLGFMAWRNIWRNPVRSLLTLSALAVGLIIVILYGALMSGMSRQMISYATSLGSGQLQLHRQSFSAEQDLYATLPWPLLTELKQQLPKLNFAPRLYAAALASSEQQSTGVMIQAIDVHKEPNVSQLLQHLRQGTLIGETATETQTSVMVGAQLANRLQLKIGSELILVTQAADGSIGNGLYHVAGIFKPLAPQFDRNGIMLSIAAYQNLMALNTGFHELIVNFDHLADLTELEQIQQQLQTALKIAPSLQPTTTKTDLANSPIQVQHWQQLNPNVANMMAMSQSMLWVIGLMIIGLATMGLINTLMMSIYERQQEFGLLVAIGMTRRLLLALVLLEALFLALIAAVAGGAIGALLAYLLEQKGIDFSASMPEGYDWAGMVFEPVMKAYLDWQQWLICCAMMVVLTMLSALIPSWRILRLKPVALL